MYLLASREHVETALTTPEEFSNSPYSALGNGTFMLGLDDDHQKQHAFAAKYLHYDAATIDALASVAFKAAAVLPSKIAGVLLAKLMGKAFDTVWNAKPVRQVSTPEIAHPPIA